LVAWLPGLRFSSAMPTLARQKKITFGEMRASGVRGLLIYCSDYKVQPLDRDQWRPMAG
jgi:hypothetical protein